MRISTSMKRAAIMFTLPGVGRSTVQENAGAVDEPLRAAIAKARKVFWEEYRKKEDERK